jgi:hypothetical protein
MNNFADMLTFGFELELVVAGSAVLATSKSFGRREVFLPAVHREVFRYFAKLLTDVGCEATAYLPTSTRSCPDYTKWNITNNSIKDHTSSGEGSPTETDFQLGMELVSPVFKLSDGWEAATRRALLRLNATDIRVNPTTVFHVHIGKTGGLCLEEVKLLAKYIIIFECEHSSIWNR